MRKRQCGCLVSTLLLFAAFLLPPIRAVAAPRLPPRALINQQDQALTVDYAAAASWLDRLPPEDQDDQIRDWAQWGLAGILGLDIRTVRNNFYDQSPLRDPLLWDLAGNHSGPARTLLDGQGTLHLLIPADDPYPARSAGMALDDYRRDAGNDPAQVVFYQYAIDHSAHSVLLTPGAAQPAADLRAALGYVEMPLTTLPELESFLSQIQHLAQLRVDGGTVWAGGWNWPDTPAGHITAEDLAVLQQAYRAARTGEGTEPGFSLDPGPALTVSELLALTVPTVYPQLDGYTEQAAGFVADWLAIGNELEFYATLTKYRELILKAILGIDPPESEGKAMQLIMGRLDELDAALADPAQPWPLLFDATDNRPGYQAARYDGGLQGTDAGMTYFYTDLVAKNWLAIQNGHGDPYGIITGFVPNTHATTPWGHCVVQNEEGRIWFGLREEGLGFLDDRVNLGSLTTRLFTLIHDPQAGDREIEPSYSFGRGIWWWDRHYLTVADYEPQYHRLDQLMRWSAAIAWLSEQDGAALPEVAETAIRRDRRFDTWLAAHDELKAQMDLPWVHPAGQATEALLTLHSQPYDRCARSWVISGGISNPTLPVIDKLRQMRPAIPGPLLRSSSMRIGTDYMPDVEAGTIAALNDVERKLGAPSADTLRIDTSSPGRKVWSFGDVKVNVGERVRRRAELQLAAGGDRLRAALSVQDVALADVDITATPTQASVAVTPQTLVELYPTLDGLQERLLTEPWSAAVADTPDALAVVCRRAKRAALPAGPRRRQRGALARS